MMTQGFSSSDITGGWSKVLHGCMLETVSMYVIPYVVSMWHGFPLVFCSFIFILIPLLAAVAVREQRPVDVLFAVAVLECGWDVYANIQPDQYDAAARPLEWLSTVPCSDAAGLPFQFVDSHK